MNKTILASLCVGSVGLLSVGHAAPFENLNFDGANTNGVVDQGGGTGGGSAPFSELVPGWQSSYGPTPLPINNTGYNLTLGVAPFSSLYSSSVGTPVVGLYSYAMVPGSDPGVSPQYLSQSGDLPADVQSIHFLSYGAPLELRVNGSPISLTYTPTASQPGWNPAVPVFDAAGDISSFAGQTVELKFTTLQGPEVYNGLDEISFSPAGVPEPSTLALFSLGGLAFLAYRFRR